jgi:hypothetical protein
VDLAVAGDDGDRTRNETGVNVSLQHVSHDEKPPVVALSSSVRRVGRSHRRTVTYSRLTIGAAVTHRPGRVAS